MSLDKRESENHEKNQQKTIYRRGKLCRMGALTFLNSVLNLKAMNAAAISNSALDEDYKAIVCILKAGGNDSFNMLVPYDQVHYDQYAATRGVGNAGVAIDRNELLPLNYNNAGREFAINPNMPELQGLFNQGKASFISNIGTLVRPTNSTDYFNKYKLPKGLYSHSDQEQEWQTGIPDERTFYGWGGRISDLLMDTNENQAISMNISLAGQNTFMTGNTAFPFAINRNNGSEGMDYYDPDNSNVKMRARAQSIDNLIGQEYQNIFEKTYMKTIGSARDADILFSAALDQSVQFDDGFFPDSQLGESLEMITRVIDVQEELGFRRQIFFVRIGGWDHHSELLNTQGAMLADVSSCLQSFMNGLEQIGYEDQVLTVNLSEFSRTLTWNGGGTDHAWAGNVWVTGGPNLINGQQVYGDDPSLDLENSEQNIHQRGRLIPTISTDEYFAEIAKWFGVPDSDLSYVLPNITEFYDPYSTDMPIGFLNT